MCVGLQPVTVKTFKNNWSKLLDSLKRIHLFKRTVLDQAVFQRYESETITCKPHYKPYSDLKEAGELAGLRSGRYKENIEYEDEWKFAGQGSITGRDDWKMISYRMTLPGLTRNEGLQRARKVLLNLDYFPTDNIRIYGQWHVESRLMKPGDRFMQQVNLIPFIPRILYTLAMEEVVHVYNDSNRVGFTVVTTSLCDEIGEHTAWVRYDEKNKVCILECASASAFDDHVFGPTKYYARWLQDKAHIGARKHLLNAFRP